MRRTAGRRGAERLGDRVVLTVVDPMGADAQDAMRQYFDELDERFPGGFGTGGAGSVDADALAPPTGVFLLARHDDRGVGCGGLQRLSGETAEVKRMWIHPDWRGLGLAKRLLGELEDHARRLGHRRVVLDTNAELHEAMSLYESSGYRPIERYNDNPYAERWYAKPL